MATGTNDVRIAFCGGCNPHIDRERLALALVDDERLSAGDAIVYISGCPRSCRTEQRLAIDRPNVVVVAGEYLDGERVPEGRLVARIRRKIERAGEK